MTPAAPVVFVDRDGTLNVDQVRRVDVDRLVLMPGARDAMRLWREAGWRVVVVTTQSGIERGLYTEEAMHAFHRALAAALGGGIEAFYWCPHAPETRCACRKPGHALLTRAARERGLDLASSFMVGDTWRDVVAGKAVGARAVLVPHPGDDYAKECLAGCGRVVAPDHVASDLAAAARWTLEAPRSG